MKLGSINTLRLPWFMYDLYNNQLITSPSVPSDISDQKNVVLAEQQVPGLNYAPINQGGNGNRKLSFSLKVIYRDRLVGNILLLKQFDQLRNQAGSSLGIRPGQFSTNPKVLYYWGTGSIPLVYYVKKCDMVHKQNWVNELGMPQYSEISFELWLDEQDDLYKGEELFRTVSAHLGQGVGAGISAGGPLLTGRPY